MIYLRPMKEEWHLPSTVDDKTKDFHDSFEKHLLGSFSWIVGAEKDCGSYSIGQLSFVV